jgi:hypothetical protein
MRRLIFKLCFDKELFKARYRISATKKDHSKTRKQSLNHGDKDDTSRTMQLVSDEQAMQSSFGEEMVSQTSLGALENL